MDSKVENKEDWAIVRFVNFKVKFTDGGIVDVVHNMESKEFSGLFQIWHKNTNNFSETHLINFVKLLRPESVCVTKEDYEEITAGHTRPATKEEWEAQNKS